MSKKSCIRTPFDSQHAKGFQILLKSALWQFYHIFESLLGKWSWKMSLLVISEIWGLFVNTLTADDKYSLHTSENFRQTIQVQLSKKLNFFPLFYFISEVYIKLSKFWKKITLISCAFQKLWTAKTWLDKCLKSPISEHRSTANML